MCACVLKCESQSCAQRWRPFPWNGIFRVHSSFSPPPERTAAPKPTSLGDKGETTIGRRLVDKHEVGPPLSEGRLWLMEGGAGSPPGDDGEEEEEVESVPIGFASSAFTPSVADVARTRRRFQLLVVALLAAGPAVTAGVVFHHLGTLHVLYRTFPASQKSSALTNNRPVTFSTRRAVGRDQAQNREACHSSGELFRDSGVVRPRPASCVLRARANECVLACCVKMSLPVSSSKALKGGVAFAIITWAAFFFAGWCDVLSTCVA